MLKKLDGYPIIREEEDGEEDAVGEDNSEDSEGEDGGGGGED